MKIWKRLVPALLALTLLAGCGGDAQQSAAPSGTQDGGPSGTQGGEKVLNVGRMAELFDMDSTIATEADCLEVISAIIEPLFVTAPTAPPRTPCATAMRWTRRAPPTPSASARTPTG